MEKAKKVFIDAEGKEARSASPFAVALVFQFANGETRKVAPSDYPETVRICFELNGLSQKLGDKYAGAESVEEAIEMFDDLNSALMEGRWLMRVAEAGPRTTDLAAALATLKPEKYPTVEDAAQAIGEWDEEKRKSAVKVPQVKAEIDKIRAARQAAKAEKSAELAGQAKAEALAEL